MYDIVIQIISVVAFFPLLSANLSVISTTSATRKNLHWSTSVESGEAYPKQITFSNVFTRRNHKNKVPLR